LPDVEVCVWDDPPGLAVDEPDEPVDVFAVFDEPPEDGWPEEVEVPVEPVEACEPVVDGDEEPEPVGPVVADPDGLVVADVELALPVEPCALAPAPLAEDVFVVVVVAEEPADGWVLEAAVDEFDEEDAFACPPDVDDGD
jgi:hypothetical protein